MDIPLHIQRALGIGAVVTNADFEAAVDLWPPTRDSFGLSAGDFAEAAAKAETSDGVDVTRLVRIPTDWRYLELVSDGSEACFGICTPKADVGVPPTNVGQSAVKAWFANSEVVDNNSIFEGVVIRSLASGYPHTDFARRLIGTWANIPLLPQEFNVPPSWLTHSEIVMPRGSRVFRSSPALKYDNLFLEAVSEIKSKWRYLSLYRILEHGYLSEVFERLQAEFFRSPKESLQRALDSVKSEDAQFISLADSASLEREFEALFDEFKNAKTALNQFACAVHHSLQQSENLRTTEKWKHGVLVCYKIRCAIVHAGLSSPIIDAYPDGEACIDMLLPTFESIALKFLGITIA